MLNTVLKTGQSQAAPGSWRRRLHQPSSFMLRSQSVVGLRWILRLQLSHVDVLLL
jgi:hypothetical protein